MEKHILELKDRRLNPDTAASCALHALVGTDSISLMAADRSGEILALESWYYSHPGKPFEEQVEEPRHILQDSPLIGLPFAQVHCALFHRGVTLVPRRLFQHGMLSEYFNLILPEGDYLYSYDEMPEFDANIVYATEKAQQKLFGNFFPQKRARHAALPLLRYVYNRAAISEHTVFVNLRHQIAQVIVLERQNLLLYNTYAFDAPADLLYFILLIYDQFKLSPKTVPLTVAGNILKDSELYKTLFRFIKEVRFAVPPVKFHLPPNVDALPEYCHLDLFCLNNP